jgi:hypothetical protein
MADKTIIINGVTFGRGTGVKIDENAEVSTEKTFDGPVNFGIDKTEYTVSVDKLIAPDVETYLAMRNVLKDMRTNKGEVTIKEIVREKGGTSYTVKEIFLGCLVSKYSKEINVDSLTTESIEFTAEDLDEEITRN